MLPDALRRLISKHSDKTTNLFNNTNKPVRVLWNKQNLQFHNISIIEISTLIPIVDQIFNYILNLFDKKK